MMKTTGRLAAMFLVTGVVGVLLVSVVKQRQKAVPAPIPDATEFGAPPMVGASGSTGAASPRDLIAMSEEGVWTRIDPTTGRLKYRMTWKRLDPGDPGEFRIESLRVWMIDAGRTLTVSSPGARIMWPSRDAEPESGELLGGVRMEAWDAEGADDAALAGAERLGTLLTESMGFAETAREWRAPGPVALESEGIRATGSGLTVRLGSGSDRPITMIRMDRDGRIEYDPAHQSKTRRKDEPPRAANVSGDADFQYYRASIREGVVVESPLGTLEAGEVLVFARTQGGRLREGAIAEFVPARSREGSDADPSADTARESPGPIVLSWRGELEIRSIVDAPTELASDDVNLLVSAGVRLAEPATGNAVVADRIHYGATTRQLRASGDRGSLSIRVADIAAVNASAIEMDLTTGEGAASGPGEVILIGRAAGSGTGPHDPGRRSVRWGERAEFTLDASEGPIGAAGQPAVKSLRLLGDVKLVDGSASLESQSIRAAFDQATDGRSTHDSRITRLSGSGESTARDAQGGIVRGDHLDVLFDADDQGRAVPKIATIRGSATAERPGESLRGELIEAILDTNERGEVIVSSVEARDGVVGALIQQSNEGEPGTITAKADRLRAHTVQRVLEMEGTPVTIERRTPNEQGVLTGGSMRAEGSSGSQSLTVFGPGEARREGDLDGLPATIDLSWQGGLIYNDSTGRAEVEGRAEVRAVRGEHERHAARGGRIEINLTPANDPGEGANARRLERAMIEGAADEPAEVELRRYLPGAATGGEPVLEALALLRGPTIEVADGTSRLRVIGPGVLLIEDRRRNEDTQPTSPSGAIELKGVRGTTLFQWEDGMMFDRDAGIGEMAGNVLIRHRDASSGQIAEIVCRRALVTTEPAASGKDGRQLSLRRAEAEGAVTGRYKDLHLSAARLVYDASAGKIGLTSEPGGGVTIHDESLARTISGEAASVDLNTGAYRIERMDSISMPR